MATGRLSYYEPNEIEDAIYDLLDLNMIGEAESLVEHGLRLHPNNETIESLTIWIYLHNHRAEEAEALFKKYEESMANMRQMMRRGPRGVRPNPDQPMPQPAQE